MRVVVRMEMPTKDRMCQMADDIDGVWYCPVMKKLCRQPDNGDIPSWCPIICQLPEGHGRLADKDLLMQDLDFLNTFDTPDDGKELSYEDILVTIDDFPTIVPAERRSE